MAQPNFRVLQNSFGFFLVWSVEIQEAKAGDLIAVSGMEDIFVGETITPTDAIEPLPILISMSQRLNVRPFLVNNSPFLQVEGNGCHPRKVEERFL